MRALACQYVAASPPRGTRRKTASELNSIALRAVGWPIWLTQLALEKLVELVAGQRLVELHPGDALAVSQLRIDPSQELLRADARSRPLTTTHSQRPRLSLAMAGVRDWSPRRQQSPLPIDQRCGKSRRPPCTRSPRVSPRAMAVRGQRTGDISRSIGRLVPIGESPVQARGRRP
jgi:hypothetical protein